MKLRTQLPAFQSSTQITHQQSIMMMGSCFTENIGARLKAQRFPTLVNPFRILYNPISIANALEQIMEKRSYFEADFVQRDGLYYSWHHHSGEFSDQIPALQEDLQLINKEAFDFLKKSQFLCITFGTAFAYEHNEFGQIVANCHKMPASLFTKKRLHTKELLQRYTTLIAQLKAFNPDLQIILTVSPIRHIKNGIIENNRSKSTLLLLCEHLESQHDHVQYFPSYELMIDDLRDYRFYKKDLLHPTEVAQDYIWEYFGNAFFSPTTQQLNKRIAQINAAVQHRPFNPTGAGHQAFAQATLKKIENLEKEFSFLDFGREKEVLNH